MKRVSFTIEGETLHGDLHEPPYARGRRAPLVVLAHGMSSSRREWFDFPTKLAKGGYAALAFDFRGHGESGGERGVQSVARAQADLAAAVEAARAEPWVDADRFALLGHSLGASLVLCAARELRPACVLALAPFHRLRDEMNPFEHAGYAVAHGLNYGARLLYRRGLSVPYKVDYSRLYVDAAAIERGRREGFLQKWIPVQNYRTLVQELRPDACAADLEAPTLVLAAEFDMVVRSTRRVYEALGARAKKFVLVPKSGHSMCGDARSDFVATACLEWLREHLGGASA